MGDHAVEDAVGTQIVFRAGVPGKYAAGRFGVIAARTVRAEHDLLMPLKAFGQQEVERGLLGVVDIGIEGVHRAGQAANTDPHDPVD